LKYRRYTGRDLLVGRPSVCREQHLRPLDPADLIAASLHERAQVRSFLRRKRHHVAYIHRAGLLADASRSIHRRLVDPLMHKFTDLQGQYLAFIHTYSLLHDRPPAEADMQRYFRVTPPSVHRMIIELESRGLIRRRPGVPRSIEVLLEDDEVPRLCRRPTR